MRKCAVVAVTTKNPILEGIKALKNKQVMYIKKMTGLQELVEGQISALRQSVACCRKSTW